jgi:hypothetical protein
LLVALSFALLGFSSRLIRGYLERRRVGCGGIGSVKIDIREKRGQVLQCTSKLVAPGFDDQLVPMMAEWIACE